MIWIIYSTSFCICGEIDYLVGECFFWYRLTRVVPDKIHKAVKWLCVYVCWLFWQNSFLGHLLRDDLINLVKVSICPYVHPSVRTYIRTSVRTYIHMSTFKLNAAINQIVVFVRVDETFMTIWLSRSSEVRVNVTWDLKFQKWWFSKSISSAIFQPIKKIPTVSDTRPKYLKSLWLDFWISS